MHGKQIGLYIWQRLQQHQLGYRHCREMHWFHVVALVMISEPHGMPTPVIRESRVELFKYIFLLRDLEVQSI